MNTKIVELSEARDGLEAEINGTEPLASHTALEAAKKRGKQWVRDRVAAKDWNALAACLIPDRFSLRDYTLERALLEIQQYDADAEFSALFAHASLHREDSNDYAAAAGRAVLQVYAEHPDNERVAKIAIGLAMEAFDLKMHGTDHVSEPLYSVAKEARSMVRKFIDAGHYSSREPFGLRDFLRWDEKRT